MKHTYVIFGALALLAFASTATSAHALSVQSTSEFKTEFRNSEAEVRVKNDAWGEVKREEPKRNDDRGVTVKTDFRANTETRIRTSANWMIEKFTAAADRLERLASRIESRIAKMEAEGHTEAQAKAHVVEARAEIRLARSGIDTLPALFTEAFAQAELKGAFEDIRKQSADIKAHIKAAHSSLIQALRELKPESSIRTQVEIKSE